MKVNGTPLLSTMSRAIKLGTSTELSKTKVQEILSALIVVIDINKARGFRILAITADCAFEAIRENEDFIETRIMLNTTSENEHEHEPFIERFNRFLNERYRICYSTLSFMSMPRHMNVELVYLQIYCINFFVPRDCISAALRPWCYSNR